MWELFKYLQNVRNACVSDVIITAQTALKGSEAFSKLYLLTN